MNKNLIRKTSLQLAVSALVLFLAYNGDASAQKLTRDLNVDLLINQVGYVPRAGKNLVTRGKVTGKFEIVDAVSQAVVFSGYFKPGPDDLGEYSTGDFTQLNRAGTYYARFDSLRSWPFTIAPGVYKPVMDQVVRYFSLQRCGASTTGYLTPCHTDDGVRMDNGKHQDVSGGWHDASDLRKWVDATIYGMVGLAKAWELQPQSGGNREKILEELIWGNQYFLKMQEPQGYVMNYVGGDVKKHSDSNRWTNNTVDKEGGDLHFTIPEGGKSKSEMLIFGSQDDRVIRTDPVSMTGQYNFVIAEAMMARITKSSDPEYSRICLAAAVKCFEWSIAHREEDNTGTIGVSVEAALELYRTTRQDSYLKYAVGEAARLRSLFRKAEEGKMGGYFLISEAEQEPYKNIWQGCWEFISLCDLATELPGHKDLPVWKEMISGYAGSYLSWFSGKNSFGIVPFGLYTGTDPGGNRREGAYWYRYFMQPLPDWWVGINSNLASAGVGLMKAADVLKDEKLKWIAQRQLDWIMGENPFNSSTIEMVGHNHPKHFAGSTFLPDVPVLPGAVLNGLGGDAADMPYKGNGDWQVSEYWTPMVAYTLWLMAELSK